ncbi:MULTISPECIES: cysteine desulfurase family protein [unclassified Flavobacterium]|uniref:cysteine desulfurase family protein n=1 Tax=unclassified Flavobacterium TaxID=196869 RepID=UPI001F1407A5|nr:MULTISPECIES: cysteine desulfurase family protein [unclassified Flavobacterium]UMY65231.1 cysteine desulfurase [Flavobacterium sp. HJ-32-4]
MGNVYLDNAATTPLRPEVISEMMTVLSADYGNPSSSHSFGRGARALLERSRKAIAKALNCQASELIFTSGATEANNWILMCAVRDLGIRRIITTRVEHHAVLHAVEQLERNSGIRVDFLKVDVDGRIDLVELETLLADPIPTLVSLMHVNNETGVVLDLQAVGTLCRSHHVLFHSDTVQSVGKTELDLQALPVDFIVASAHKFHGPKGVGFAFVRKGPALHAMFYGGEQEKGLRPGTESVHNVAGMATALTMSLEHLQEEREAICRLKEYAWERLTTQFPGTRQNGADTFYNILNVTLPLPESKTPLLLFALDMKGIAVSRGSACQSGSARPSHVLAEMLDDATLARPSLRISFSHYNTTSDIDALIDALSGV